MRQPEAKENGMIMHLHMIEVEVGGRSYNAIAIALAEKSTITVK